MKIFYSEEAENESSLDILKQLYHPNILRYFRSGRPDPKTYYLLSGFCETDLEQIMEKKSLKDFDERKKCLKDLCEGLQYLHNVQKNY